MKALLLAAVAAATLAPSTQAHAEFSAPRRPEFRIAPSRAKAKPMPARAALAPKKEEAEVHQPTLSVDDVMTKIQTVYMAGLQRCYRISLATEPNLSGKVTLQFTVDAKGRVLSDMEGITPTFDACLNQMIGAWRFPHTSEPAEATFKMSLVLAK